MNDPMALMREFRNRRRELGLTQVELARKAHVSQSMISRMEQLTDSPNLGALCRIADVLNIRLQTERAPLTEILSVQKLAQVYGVRENTARRWIREGMVELDTEKKDDVIPDWTIPPVVRNRYDLEDSEEL